jgi:hypothetical protein
VLTKPSEERSRLYRVRLSFKEVAGIETGWPEEELVSWGGEVACKRRFRRRVSGDMVVLGAGLVRTWWG